MFLRQGRLDQHIYCMVLVDRNEVITICSCIYSIRIVQQRSFLLFSRQKQDEVMRLEEQIRAKADQQRKDGQELDSTCQICLKTKFADGIGHTCNYCNVRCCARCGGKVALRSSKV